MADMTNPNSARIVELLGLIDVATEQMNTANRLLAAQQTRLASWMANYRGPGHSSEADTAIADAQRWIATHQAEVRQHQARIAELNTQLEQARAAAAQWDAAMASAAAQGLTGDAAVEHARSVVQREKGKTFLLVAVGVALLLLLVLWIYKRYAAA